MLWDPGAAKVVGIAGSGRSPRSLTLETVRSRLRNGFIPPYGALPVSVPGTVDMWWTLPGKYGKLKWVELFVPVIAFADSGSGERRVGTGCVRQGKCGGERTN